MSDDSDGDRSWQVRTRTVVYALVFLALTAGVAIAITGTVPVSDGVTLQAPDGMTVTLDGSTDALLEEPFPTSGTVEWTTEDGNVSFFSSGAANATIHKDDLEGTFTNVTEIDADPNSITIDPDDKDSALVAQEIDEFAWRSGIAADDSTVDFTYTASGPGEVTVQGLSGSTRYAAVNASNDEIIDDATSNGGGAVTFDALDSGTADVLIQTFTPDTPALSNPSPTGETAEEVTEVSIDINDGDFPAGDSVDVTIDLDSSQIHSETINSNQTVTASVPASGRDGGEHTWTVNATDDFGESTENQYSYTVPQNLTVHDEETGEIIDDQQVNLTVYTQSDDPEILTFNTSNGMVDLGEGFPSSDPFIVVADSEGYLDRRIFVASVYETQELYLLNESLEHRDVIFRIEDYSGTFPPSDTVLEVQRGIGGNWTTVLGDFFGANDQFESQIRYNTRHRLVLVNAETGDRRILGSYTPLASGTETITVSPSGELDLPDTHPTVSFTPDARQLPAESGIDLSTTISNGTIAFDSWGVDIYHIAPNGTNTTLFSDTSTDATGGTVEETVDLSGREGTVKVVTSYELEGGATGSSVATYNIQGDIQTTMTLLDGILGMVGLVPNSDADTVLTLGAMIFVIVGTTAVGSVFAMSTEEMGAVTLILVAAFAVIGWVEYTLLFTVLVLFASVVFIRRRW